MSRVWILAALVVATQAVTTNQDAQVQARPSKRAGDVLNAARSLRLTAKLQKAVVPSGKPVLLSLVLKNEGHKPFHLTDAAESDVNFLLRAKRKDGRSVSLTRYGTYVSQGGYTKVAGKPSERFSSSEFVTLKRGVGKQYVLPASKIYDMTRKGTYVLTVVRQFVLSETLTLNAKSKNERTWELSTQNEALSTADKGKAVRLVSNTVTVTVE